MGTGEKYSTQLIRRDVCQFRGRCDVLLDSLQIYPMKNSLFPNMIFDASLGWKILVEINISKSLQMTFLA